MCHHPQNSLVQPHLGIAPIELFHLFKTQQSDGQPCPRYNRISCSLYNGRNC